MDYQSQASFKCLQVQHQLSGSYEVSLEPFTFTGFAINRLKSMKTAGIVL